MYKNRNLLFPASKRYESPNFVVFPGRCVLLSAFNLPKYLPEEVGEPSNRLALVVVQKVHFEGAVPPQGECQCGELTEWTPPGIDEAYIEDVTQCGLWCLESCQNLKVLSTPGVYRVRFNHTALIESVVVVAAEYETSDHMRIPERMLFGG